MSTDDFGKYMESLVGGGSAVPDFSHFLTDSLEEEEVVQSGKKGEEPQQDDRGSLSPQENKVPAEEMAKNSPQKKAAVRIV